MPESGPLVAILAAGGSRRLGMPKQLVRIGGMPLVRRQCLVALPQKWGRSPSSSARTVQMSRRRSRTCRSTSVGTMMARRNGVVASPRRDRRTRESRRGAARYWPVISIESPLAICDIYATSGVRAAVVRASRGQASTSVLRPCCRRNAMTSCSDFAATPGRVRSLDPRRVPPLEVGNPRASFDIDHPDDVEVSRRAWECPSQR